MNNVGYLQVVSVTSDDIGNRIETVTSEKKVYGSRKDVASFEYYNALSANHMKLEFGFEIWKKQYNDEEFLKYEDEIYTIVRALYNKKDKVTLIVKKRVD